MRIVQFEDGKYAVRVGFWPFYSYLSRNNPTYRWARARDVRFFCLVAGEDDARAIIKLHYPPKPPKEPPLPPVIRSVTP